MKNKVGIIYNGTKGADWAIEYFKTEFESKGMKVALFDANKLDEKYSKFNRGSYSNRVCISNLLTK